MTFQKFRVKINGQKIFENLTVEINLKKITVRKDLKNSG